MNRHPPMNSIMNTKSKLIRTLFPVSVSVHVTKFATALGLFVLPASQIHPRRPGNEAQPMNVPCALVGLWGPDPSPPLPRGGRIVGPPFSLCRVHVAWSRREVFRNRRKREVLFGSKINRPDSTSRASCSQEPVLRCPLCDFVAGPRRRGGSLRRRTTRSKHPKPRRFCVLTSQEFGMILHSPHDWRSRRMRSLLVRGRPPRV